MIYKTPKGTEIDIECAMVYVNRPDLALRTLACVPKDMQVNFVQEVGLVGSPSLEEEVKKRPNLKFYTKEQQGCATDWNFCLKQCTSKYVLLMSTDIEMLNGLIDRSIDVFVPFKESTKSIFFPFHCRWMKVWLIEREAFLNMGGFHEGFWIGGEDDDAIMTACSKGYNVGIFYTGSRHDNDMVHMDGGKHTRNIRNPGVHLIKGDNVIWRKWNITSKDMGKQLWADLTTGHWETITIPASAVGYGGFK